MGVGGLSISELSGEASFGKVGFLENNGKHHIGQVPDDILPWFSKPCPLSISWRVDTSRARFMYPSVKSAKQSSRFNIYISHTWPFSFWWEWQ